MAIPNSRDTFVQYCLRRLGKPVVQVNVTAEQCDDLVDFALAKFRDYHFDGVERTYVKHQVTDADKTNGYVTVDDAIIEVVDLFPFSATLLGVGMWNVQYQAIFSAMDVWRSLDVGGWAMMMQNLQFMEEVFAGRQPIRFSRYSNKLYVDTDWDMIVTGDWLVADAYATVDPTVQVKVWGDPWLQQYATALIKRQWGGNMKKYGGVPMIGGVTFNGQQIHDEAEEEIRRLDDRLITDYSCMPQDFIG